MEERVLTKDLLVTTYADVKKDITAKTVKVCSQIIMPCTVVKVKYSVSQLSQ